MVWAEIALAAIAGSLFYGLIALAGARGDILASVVPRARGGRRWRRDAMLTRWLAGALALGLLSGAAEAQAPEKVTLQLKWVTQAQFAGYYVAKDKGFYKEAGLDVTIKPGGPDIAPPQVIAGGGADVVVEWMPAALAAREKGVPLVNIAQPFKRSGMQLTCRAETGVKQPADLKGRTLGVWFSGNEYPFLAWMAKLGLKTDGSRGEGAEAGLQRRPADPEAGRLHLHHDLQRVLAGHRRGLQARAARGLQVRGPGRRDAGGRALRASQDKLKDPAFVARMAKFVAASAKGWDYARKNPAEAAKIVLENDATGAQTEKHQARMMGEIAKLLDAQRDGQARPGRLRAHGRRRCWPPAATRR